ncbi:hypothetical protein ACFQH9_07710 [Pseudonocardia lutea]|jgi:hypothetical protein|uniref:Roadblock/LAMTOR2 domain-containing protein n=1 Tax=Pseudonocardia lutea TaxID=2172015 RepID=A0ABW1I3D8_9PSEU
MIHPTARTEVRRADDEELIGFVEPAPDGTWRALSVFGGLIATAGTEEAATAEITGRGLAVLAETWWFRGEPAVLLEAAPGRVVARVGGIAALAAVVGSGAGEDGHRLLTLTGAEIGELTLARP